MRRPSAFFIRQLVYLAIVFSFILMLVYPFVGTEGSSLELHCLFKQFTGKPCPTCGMSRSFLLLWQGNWPVSLRYNLFTIPVYLFYGYLAVQALRALLLRREFTISTSIAILFLVVLILAWVWKFVMGSAYY